MYNKQIEIMRNLGNNPGKIEVEKDSNIAKILNGKTRGYEDYYVRHIFSNRDLYTVKR